MKIPTRERDALKRHDMRAVKQCAQARLNRAAVAWCRAWDEHGWARLPDEKLAKAVRAFQKAGAK